MVDIGRSVAARGPGMVSLVGETQSEDFPVTPHGYDLTFNGGWDAFLVTLRVAPSMHVQAIVPEYRPVGSGYVVGAGVQIALADGSLVNGARVQVRLTYPDGQQVVLAGTTGSSGIALVARPATDSGTYRFTVLDVARSPAVYDPSQNAETTDSLTIP